LWIAAELGLYQFDRHTGRFTIGRLANGQSLDERVTGQLCRIAEDGDGNIWFSSNNGLGKYDPKNKTLKKYYETDGLQANAFTQAHFKSKNGEMFFGGSNGISVFYPDSIKEDPYAPKIVITNFKKMNKKAELDTSILYKKKIILAHDENIFSIEYTALNFTDPKRNQFAHKLEGFDKDWIYTGNRREVTYTNLEPGQYTFYVKGSNSDGIWNEAGTSVKIIITQPWWRTNWAYFVYFLLFTLFLCVLYIFNQKRQGLKKKLELEHLFAQKLEESKKDLNSIEVCLNSQQNSVINSNDEIFLDRVQKIIDRSLDDPDFNVSRLSSELGISRRHLTRKFETLTGDTAVHIIRRIRLERAAKLLRTNGHQIVNIAYEVGFNSPSYFAKCFRKQYDLNPSQYAALFSKNGKM
jgi:AraC-like DNA-binding protein